MCQLLALLFALPAFAQLELVPNETPQAIFAGQPQQVRVAFHNPTDKPVTTELKWRLYQVTSGAKVPVDAAQTWKKLEVLPGQTVLEKLPVTLPELRASSAFEIQWTGLGRTPVVGFPTNVLNRLPPLKLHDPDGHLPMLREADEEKPRLWIVWAKALPEDRPAGLPVVWIKPSKAPAAVVRGAVVEVPAVLLNGLADSPLPQLNLLRFAELVLPQPNENQP